MNVRLDLHAKLDAAIAKCEQLEQRPLIAVSDRKTLPQTPAVYVFYDKGLPVHVGRCKKLRDRIQGQCAGTLESSTFAFKRTRANIANSRSDESYLRASYRPTGSRKELFARPYFREEFDRVIDWLKGTGLRYLATDDDVDQYLLELAVANKLAVSMDEFRTT